MRFFGMMANGELHILQEQQAELMRRYKQLREENTILRQANEYQREELLRTHEELTTLQKQYKQLSAVNALLGGEEQREQAKRKLTQMIALVDKALAGLEIGNISE